MHIVATTKTQTDGVFADTFRGKKRPVDSGYTSDEDGLRAKRVRTDTLVGVNEQLEIEHVQGNSFQHDNLESTYQIPLKQRALLLHKTKQPYTLEDGHDVPQARIADGEVLVKIQTIGLNPIDWKAPDFGFAIPELPYIAGRDFVGVIVSDPSTLNHGSSRTLRRGDVVSTASTDYRDLRKAAFQEYAVASRFNVSRISSNVHREKMAGVGVAFIAAVLAVGVCFGADFSQLEDVLKGPNLLEILKEHAEMLPKDVREECLQGIDLQERPQKGDWVVFWGGSSTTALLAAQICKLLGLRVIKVLDVGKHGELLSQGPVDLLVDSHDSERAISIIRRVTGNKLRFAIDTIGRPTAELLRRSLRFADKEDKYSAGDKQSHLVGLTGLPKVPSDGIKQHTVPIKIHHEVPEVGEALMEWLEVLVREEKIIPPAQDVIDGGLEKVNVGLDKMRRGKISGRRLAVRLS